MEELNWHKIYTQLSPKLLGICRRYIKDIATAEDVVQDSFIIAIQKQNHLKNSASVNGWMSRIVINNAINFLKNENKISYSSTQNFEFADETTMSETLELDKKSAILASDFTQQDLLEAIDLLPENHKSVFNLYIIDQFSHVEISDMLKISVGTSKSSLSRARKTVQDILMKKLNGHKTDENKKRRIAFLLFFGFGNQMFAHYFRRSFSSFEISPKQPLNLNRNPAISSIDVVAKTATLLPYLSAGILAIGLSFYGFYLMKNQNDVTSDDSQIIKNEIVATEIISDSINVDSIKKKLTIEPKTKNTEKNSTVNNTKSKAKIVTPINVVKNDSADKKEPQKVVVVKKQIVKKDTVYVQR